MTGPLTCSTCGTAARRINWKQDGSEYDIVCPLGHRQRVKRQNIVEHCDINRMLCEGASERKLPKITGVRNLYKVFLSGVLTGVLPAEGECTLQVKHKDGLAYVQVAQGAKMWLAQAPDRLPEYTGPGLVLSIAGPTNPGVASRAMRMYIVEISQGIQGPEIDLDPVAESVGLVQRDRDRKGLPDPTLSAAAKKAHRLKREQYRSGVEKWTKSAAGKAFYRRLARWNAQHGGADDPAQGVTDVLDKQRNGKEQEPSMMDLLRKSQK